MTEEQKLGYYEKVWLGLNILGRLNPEASIAAT